jgi:hypothetical protein
MTVVVILRNGKGDQPVESRRVKALVGWEVPGLIRTGGRATGQAVAQANWISLEIRAPRETDCGIFESAEPLRSRRRLISASTIGHIRCTNSPGSMRTACQEGICSKSSEPLVGRLGAPAQRRHMRISHQVVKSRCACERDGWGRVSDDGPGQYNLDWSEDPWGGGRPTLHGGAFSRSRPDTEQDHRAQTDLCTKGGDKPDYDLRMSGAGLSRKLVWEGPAGKPAFQPYRGKPAVRNDREGRGNVGIIRSPVRASTLPD